MTTKEDWLIEAYSIQLKKDRAAAWMKFGAFLLLIGIGLLTVIGFTLSIQTAVARIIGA